MNLITTITEDNENVSRVKLMHKERDSDCEELHKHQEKKKNNRIKDRNGKKCKNKSQG